MLVIVSCLSFSILCFSVEGAFIRIRSFYTNESLEMIYGVKRHKYASVDWLNDT